MTADLPLRRSSRDPELLRARLASWFTERLGPDAQPSVSALSGTEANGMSSDTVLFDLTCKRDGVVVTDELVARLAPDRADVPVFPRYDMVGQFKVLERVRALTDAPVPEPLWCEPDPTALGSPFFIMRRVGGLIPPDVLPYPFGGNWLYDADPVDQRRLQDGTVDALAALHRIDSAPQRFSFLERDRPGDSYLQRHVAQTRTWYQLVAADAGPVPLLERGFDWLARHWPAHEPPPALSWGDARIGNVIYRDFSPVALLDWEMSGLGPPELDVAWLVFAHEVFQALAAALGLDGMPEFLRAEDVCARYEQLTGHTPRDLDFYRGYAGLQWGIVFVRTGCRQAHFGERELPDDPEELIYNRDQLAQLFST